MDQVLLLDLFYRFCHRSDQFKHRASFRMLRRDLPDRVGMFFDEVDFAGGNRVAISRGRDRTRKIYERVLLGVVEIGSISYLAHKMRLPDEDACWLDFTRAEVEANSRVSVLENL